MTDTSKHLVPLIDRLAGFFFLAKRYSAALHADLNLSTGERAILLQLAKDGVGSVPELAAQRGISRQAIQKTANLLATRGLLEKRLSSTDRRNRELVLTAQGHDFLTDLRAAELAEAQTFASDFSSQDIARFEAMLGQIEIAMSARAADLISARSGET